MLLNSIEYRESANAILTTVMCLFGKISQLFADTGNICQDDELYKAQINQLLLGYRTVIRPGCHLETRT